MSGHRITIQTPNGSYTIHDGLVEDLHGPDREKVGQRGLKAGADDPGGVIEPSDSPSNLSDHGKPKIFSTSFDGAEFRFESGQMAIVDAAILDAIDHPLKAGALVLSIKDPEVTFSVSAEFDDSVMLSAKIEPKADSSGNMDDGAKSETPEMKGDSVVPPTSEGALPGLDRSHDDSMTRRARELDPTSGQREHNKSREKHGSVPSPEKRALHKRDNDGANGYTESVTQFLAKHMGKTTLTESVVAGVDKQALSEALRAMFVMHLGGWEKEQTKVTHPFGVTLEGKRWDVSTHGYVIDKTTGERPSFDLDWIQASREFLNG